MGKGIIINVEGSKAVIGELTKYGKNSQKIILKEALIAGFAIQSKAKVRVPVDTGRLRSSLNTTKQKDGVKVGTNVEYAAFIEDGTSRMKARPYLFNSFKEQIPKFISRVKRALKK